VDLNLLAVELARLSLWIHTFIPGLPLSLLDYHLVQGNSLVGIATLKEAQQLVEVASGGPLFNQITSDLIAQAAESVARVGRLADTDAAEVFRAREALQKARKEEESLVAMMDILVASRVDNGIVIDIGVLQKWRDNPAIIPGSELRKRALKALSEIPPFHFPAQFPDVFQRERAGFDVIIGNPPWEEIQPEEHQFWPRYNPGYRGVPQREREQFRNRIRVDRPDLVAIFEKELENSRLLQRYLTSAEIPGFETGDADVYKAFCWRFWQLAAEPGGRIGVVLPRSAWYAKGSGPFRRETLTSGQVVDLTWLLNNQQWIFEDVHPQYTITLTSLEKASPHDDTNLTMRGPYRSLIRYHEGIKHEPVRFLVKEVLGWTDTASLPLLPSEESIEVFAQLRKAPRLDLDDRKSWRARPYRELDATLDKPLMVFSKERPEGYWPVFKGESFDIWENDNGLPSYYAWIDPEIAIGHLQKKRLRASKVKGSVFREFPMEWLMDINTLPCFRPRIAFRNVTNRTNRRTVIAALLPSEVVITNAAPYLLWPRGNEEDEAYLLGILSSLPLDWYARRFVEINLNFFLFKPFPVPRPPRSNILYQRTIALAGRLASRDEQFSKWASAIGVKCGPLEPDDKEDMIHELDAVVAHLYGLTEYRLRHIFETFHEGWDNASRMEATLKHYRSWREKI